MDLSPESNKIVKFGTQHIFNTIRGSAKEEDGIICIFKLAKNEEDNLHSCGQYVVGWRVAGENCK